MNMFLIFIISITHISHKIFLLWTKINLYNCQEFYYYIIVKQCTRDRRSEGRDDVSGDVSELVLGVVALVGGVWPAEVLFTFITQPSLVSLSVSVQALLVIKASPALLALDGPEANQRHGVECLAVHQACGGADGFGLLLYYRSSRTRYLLDNPHLPD